MKFPPLHFLPRLCGYLLFGAAGAAIATHDSPLGIVGAIVLALLFIDLADRVRDDCARAERRIAKQRSS